MLASLVLLLLRLYSVTIVDSVCVVGYVVDVVVDVVAVAAVVVAVVIVAGVGYAFILLCIGVDGADVGGACVDDCGVGCM